MIGDFLGFYFSRTKHVWKLKFGLWGSFGILNRYEFFQTEIQTGKLSSGNPPAPRQLRLSIRVVVRHVFEVFCRFLLNHGISGFALVVFMYRTTFEARFLDTTFIDIRFACIGPIEVFIYLSFFKLYFTKHNLLNL